MTGSLRKWLKYPAMLACCPPLIKDSRLLSSFKHITNCKHTSLLFPSSGSSNDLLGASGFTLLLSMCLRCFQCTPKKEKLECDEHT